MAKILIAGLGKGMIDRNSEERDYRKADYKIKIEETGEYKIYRDEYFVTSVLEKHYDIDKTIYIGTAGSMWDKLYTHYCKKNGFSTESEEYEKYRDELRNVTKNANKNTDVLNINSEKFNSIFENTEKKVQIIVTKYGMNKNEIFENFNKIIEIVNSLNKEDEIYLDITHSFRSNAMWIFLVMNYITEVIDKNIKIKMITYGMLEEMDDDEIEKDLNGNPLKVAPIINLKSFYDLMKWIKGANAFKQYGNTYEFLDMIEDNKLKNTLEEFSNSMNMNYIGNIKENIGKINRIEKTIKTLDGPAKLLLPDILERFAQNFGEKQETFEILLDLAEWHYNQKRYSMSYVNIIEAIYTFTGKILEVEDINKGKEVLREWINRITEENKIKYKDLSEEEISNRIKLSEIFESSRIIRNNISHTLESRAEMQEVISKIPENIQKLREIFKTEYKKGEIHKSQDLKMQQTYTFLEKLAENGQFAEIGKVASNGIYDFLFEKLGVQKSGENKNIVKNWLDNKKGNFEKELEKEQLSELMKLFLEVKNNSRSITEKEIVKKIRHLQNILTKKSFLEAIENVNLNDKGSSQIKQAPKINLNKEDRKILVFKELFGEQEKSEVIKKYKIKRISKLSSETAKEWKNLENDSNKEKNIKRFKDIIDRNIDSGDILLIEGEVGITFELVNWAKEKGIIAIYGVEKVTDNFLLKVEFYEY